MYRRTFLLGSSAFLVACQGGGPRGSTILGGATETITSDAEANYLLVNVNDEIARKASLWLERTERREFIPDAGASPVVIGVGDTLEVTIISASDVGFIDLTNSSLSPLSLTTLPPQQVQSDGSISVPPIGRISANGQTVQRFETSLTQQLSEVLVAPTAVVQLTERQSARVSILGQIGAPGTFSIDLNDMRLIELIARAGGPAARSDTLGVTLSRQGRVGRVQLDELYANPQYNIYLQPGDIVSVEPLARKFTVLGAGGLNTTLLLDENKVTLADALGQAGGLLNRRADRKGVFVYRFLPRQATQDLGATITSNPGEPFPTVFRFDLTRPESLFLAGQFDVGDGDVLYISDGILEDIDALFSVFTNFAPTPAEYIRDATIN